MNLQEITKDEAVDLYGNEPNKLWVMRMLPAGPVDLLPVLWTEMHSRIFTSEWFFRNRFTRYFKADVDAVEDVAPALKELRTCIKNSQDYMDLDLKGKMEQLSLF